MAALKRLAALYVFAVGGAIALHFLITRFYDPEWVDASLPIWQILNPLQVIGLAIVLVVAYGRKRNLDADDASAAISREYLEANVVFYFAAALFQALLWNWFGVQWADPATSDNQLWVLIDVTLPLLLYSTGLRLWRDARSDAA